MNDRAVDSSATHSQDIWGSDVVARSIRSLGFPYVCLNPGASFRGLHDSLVNFLGNENPEIILCLHEEVAIEIAHGYAKVTEKPLACIIHANVGLMHATMGIFNIWCDRVPAIIFGATGPIDTAKRRPWTDWIHTFKDQGALIRHYTKWDDQPTTAAAVQELILRAHMLATTAPKGAAYVCVDAGFQEEKLASVPDLPNINRFRAPAPAAPNPTTVDAAAAMLASARNPVILAGRVSRSESDWKMRIQLAELLGAQVFTDVKVAAAFPTLHPLHGGPPTMFASPDMLAKLRAADVLLSFDWVDLAGTLKAAFGETITAKIIQVSVDQQIHNGWSMDHQGLPPVDIMLLNEPDTVLGPLIESLKASGLEQPAAGTYVAREAPIVSPDHEGPIDLDGLSAVLRVAFTGRKTCLIRAPIMWTGDLWPVDNPLSTLGYDGGGGVGSGPGMAVGAALALRGTDRVPLAVIGDGDFIMGNQAVWTAVNRKIPLIVVVSNNAAYYADVLHQERMAIVRSRPLERKTIGQEISEPRIDLAKIAEAQGAVGLGKIESISHLRTAVAEAIKQFDAGKVVVLDVTVDQTMQTKRVHQL